MPEASIRPSTRFETILGILFLFLLLIGCLLVAMPFLTSLMWAAIFCFAIWPIQERLVRAVRGRRTLAALITTLTISLIVLAPFAVIGFNLPEDLRSLQTATRQWLIEGPPAPPAWLGRIPLVGSSVRQYWEDIAVDIGDLGQKLSEQSDEDASLDIAVTQPSTAPYESRLVTAGRRLLSWARVWLVSALLAVGHGIVEVTLSVLFTFFLLRDGHYAAERLRSSLSRIAGERGQHLLDVAGGTVRGVVYGILGTAVAQGLLAGIGFLIAGIPGAPLLGLLTAFLSFLPVGPPLVWIPASLWLFHGGYTGWGIFMICWGILVSSVDNVVKPWLISQGSAMPFILIFMGVLGGALAFGIIGVFIGPTIIAVVYRILQDWLAEPPAPSQLPASEKTAIRAD
jgi:predicted PurR-regulated permease PerM